MNRLPSLAVTLIGFGFFATGLFLVFEAETDDDLLMAGVITLFFAAVPWQQPDGCIIVGPSRLRSGIFALGGLAFLVSGIVIALRMLESGFSMKLLLGVLGAPFGVIVLVFALRQMVVAGPLYILDGSGTGSRNGMKWRLAWKDVANISTGRACPNAWLMFDTLPHFPDPPGRLARLNRRFNMPPYAVKPGTRGVDFNALADTVFMPWAAHRDPGASA